MGDAGRTYVRRVLWSPSHARQIVVPAPLAAAVAARGISRARLRRRMRDRERSVAATGRRAVAGGQRAECRAREARTDAVLRSAPVTQGVDELRHVPQPGARLDGRSLDG